MTARAIPFSQEDRATIRSTATWMLLAGAILAAAGGYLWYTIGGVVLTLGVLGMRVLATPVIVATSLLGMGVLLVLGSRSFMRVAGDGQVAALSRGFLALTAIYIVQATVMLLMLGMFFFSFFLPMFMM